MRQASLCRRAPQRRRERGVRSHARPWRRCVIEGISKQRGSAFATASTSPRRSAQPTHLRLRGKLTIYRASHEQALKPGLVPAAVLASGSLKLAVWTAFWLTPSVPRSHTGGRRLGRAYAVLGWAARGLVLHRRCIRHGICAPISSELGFKLVHPDLKLGVVGGSGSEKSRWTRSNFCTVTPAEPGGNSGH